MVIFLTGMEATGTLSQDVMCIITQGLTVFLFLDANLKLEKDCVYSCPICAVSLVGVDELKNHITDCSKPEVKPTIYEPGPPQPVREVNGVVEILDSDDDEIQPPPAKT